MINKRVIPFITIIGDKMVKTNLFENPIYIGDPINAIRIFNEKEVDEIVIIDINCTKNKSLINIELIKSMAEECFMPITYGGGIKRLDDAKQILSLGIEKIMLQNGAFTNPNFIKDLVVIYGSSSIGLSIDIKKIKDKYYIFDYFTKDTLKINIDEFLNKFIDLGIGEFCFNIVNLDGTLHGPDFEFIQNYISKLNIPCIYVGGISSIRDIHNLYKTNVSGIGVGKFFSLYGPHNAPLIRYYK
jgi:cyclase